MKKHILILILSFLLFANTTSTFTIDGRLGGSPTDWSIVGNTVYQPENVSMQVGVSAWHGKANNNGQLFVTLPSTYGGGNTPLIFVQIIGANNKNVSYSVVPLFSGFIVYWQTTDNTNKTYIEFEWVSLGQR